VAENDVIETAEEETSELPETAIAQNESTAGEILEEPQQEAYLTEGSPFGTNEIAPGQPVAVGVQEVRCETPVQLSATEDAESSDDESIVFGFGVSSGSSKLIAVSTKIVSPTVSNVAAVQPSTATTVEGSESTDDAAGDTWETVGVKTKGKAGRRHKSERQPVHFSKKTSGPSFTGHGEPLTPGKKKGDFSAGVRKSKTLAHSADASHRNAEVSSTAKDVDHTPRSPPGRNASTGKPIPDNIWSVGVPAKAMLSQGGSASLVAPITLHPPAVSPLKKETTLRDVLLGKHKLPVPIVTPDLTTARPQLAQPPPTYASKVSSAAKPKGGIASADQNTAPTYQETISATSSAHVVRDAMGLVSKVNDPLEKSDTESVDTDEAPQNTDRASVEPSEKVVPPAPPLPTLLSPHSVNSANSSVASSLEVPHTATHRHHSKSVDVKDVGYHLLDVCDRLTCDMNLFMSRRAVALNSRRRERGALLTALQDAVGSIWPGRCHVDMYGSCATQLDLPSSDLDVIVRGMDHTFESSVSLPSTPSEAGGLDGISRSMSMDDSAGADLSSKNIPTLPVSAYGPLYLQMNGHRVLKLANTLEQLPWAVQVKSIPTASVPVVKILADPSKLPGGMEHLGHLPSQVIAAVGSSKKVLKDHPSDADLVEGQCGYLPSAPQPWRGADVMNGLLKLDITFEGPEHGGIGSTDFSSYVVSEFAEEAGVMPEATPFVQVLMVLKELLAQRKLNEPYSGGLGSYALLLLLVALVRERAVIREEIERSEMQRMAVAADDVSRFTTSITDKPAVGDDTSSGPRWPWASVPSEVQSVASSVMINETMPSVAGSGQRGAKIVGCQSSSWASIAKKLPVATKASAEGAVSASVATTAVSTSDVAAHKHRPMQSELVIEDNGKKKSPAVPTSSCASSARRTAVRSDQSKASLESETAAPSQEVFGALPSAAIAENFEIPHFPQSFNDVIEVLCSGQTTAGKLLMHFLLYYGQHFDANSTAIDISGKHEREYSFSQYSYFSPYITRRNPSSIDPYTGMLTVDPIVIYDPLQGAENLNVARRCFAWKSIRWIFAQSYSTLSTAVEQSASPPASPGGLATTADAYVAGTSSDSFGAHGGSRSPVSSINGGMAQGQDHNSGTLPDPSSPLLSCLLSF
jgi:hypothetical protein